MQDKPSARIILGEVQAALRAGIAPGFQQVVASNAIALALREDELAASGHAAEQMRLAAILGHDVGLEQGNRTLSEGLRDGSIDAGRTDVTTHLVATTIEKMRVDQPNYPAFRVWQAEQETHS
ncbi:MAG: DUF6285 domain-containing protein [Sphingomonadaceae bacterium]